MPTNPICTSAASHPGIDGPASSPLSSSPSSAPSTAYGSTGTRNPVPTQAQNTSGTAGMRIPHGRPSASATVIPIPAIPIVAPFSTTHSATPNPAPTGSSPTSEPATHDTLISRYGVSASAAPCAAPRPARSHRSI